MGCSGRSAADSLGAVDGIGTPTALTCSSDQEHVDKEKSSLILVHIFK